MKGSSSDMVQGMPGVGLACGYIEVTATLCYCMLNAELSGLEW